MYNYLYCYVRVYLCVCAMCVTEYRLQSAGVQYYNEVFQFMMAETCIHDHVSNLVCYYKCVKTKNVNL